MRFPSTIDKLIKYLISRCCRRISHLWNDATEGTAMEAWWQQPKSSHTHIWLYPLDNCICYTWPSAIIVNGWSRNITTYLILCTSVSDDSDLEYQRFLSQPQSVSSALGHLSLCWVGTKSVDRSNVFPHLNLLWLREHFFPKRGTNSFGLINAFKGGQHYAITIHQYLESYWFPRKMSLSPKLLGK